VYLLRGEWIGGPRTEDTGLCFRLPRSNMDDLVMLLRSNEPGVPLAVDLAELMLLEGESLFGMRALADVGRDYETQQEDI